MPIGNTSNEYTVFAQALNSALIDFRPTLVENIEMSNVQFKTVGNVKVAYEIQGNGSPLLLLHGGEADLRMFRDAASYLQKSFRTIAYDQRGCGETTVVDDSEYGLEDLADDAAGLIVALGYEKMHVLGHSAGGLVAQMLALRWPGRVDKLILEATISLADSKRLMQDATLKERMKSLAAGGPAASAEFFATPKYVAEHPEIVDRLGELRGSQSPEIFMRRMRALQTYPEVDLRKIKAETLVLYAEEDQAAQRAPVEKMAKAIPNAKFEIYPEAGHIGIIQFPEGYSRVIKAFLKG
jgi:pimeloyl-ACP methyl ester carboxylesterase